MDSTSRIQIPPVIVGVYFVAWEKHDPTYSLQLLQAINKAAGQNGLVWFYGISTIVGYKCQIQYYRYKQFYFK